MYVRSDGVDSPLCGGGDENGPFSHSQPCASCDYVMQFTTNGLKSKTRKKQKNFFFFFFK
jgi:hypothetical protein